MRSIAVTVLAACLLVARRGAALRASSLVTRPLLRTTPPSAAVTRPDSAPVGSQPVVVSRRRQPDVVVLRAASTEETTEESPPPLTEAQADAKRATLEFTPTKYFFGRVAVYLGPQYKPLSEVVEPSFKDDTSAVSAVVLEPPFGMIIEESARFPGRVEVAEVTPGSNADVAGVKVGDVLRGTTAMALDVRRASEEDAAFSVGLSEGRKQRAYLSCDRQPFERIMEALQSNAAANGGPGEAALVFERQVK